MRKEKRWDKDTINKKIYANYHNELRKRQRQGVITQYQPDPLREKFERIRVHMPERNRLANDLFDITTLRSSVGKQALQDLIDLCKRRTEIETYLGLEQCHCVRDKKDWSHIYACVKRRLEKTQGGGDFCFVCHQWIATSSQWEAHCQSHLDTLNIHHSCNPLYEGKMFAAPGLCPFCLSNSVLCASARFYQFTSQAKWASHVYADCNEFLQEMAWNNPVTCVHPLCTLVFTSKVRFVDHLNDAHCPGFLGRHLTPMD